MAGIQTHRRTLGNQPNAAAQPTTASHFRPPSGGQVLGDAQQFIFTASPDADYTCHEYTLNGGASWQNLIWTAVEYNYTDYPAVTVGVRVKAAGNVLESATLWAPAISKPQRGENADALSTQSNDVRMSNDGYNIGWIYRSAYYGQRVWLNVIIDDVLVAKIQANDYIYGGYFKSYGDNDGYVGYSFEPPHRFRDGQDHVIVYAWSPTNQFGTGNRGRVFNLTS